MDNGTSHRNARTLMARQLTRFAIEPVDDSENAYRRLLALVTVALGHLLHAQRFMLEGKTMF